MEDELIPAPEAVSDPVAKAPSAEVLGVRVSALMPDDLHTVILRTVREKGKARLLNVNAHALNLAYERPWLRDYFNSAEVVFPDGYGAVLAARFLGSPFKERVTYADWFWQLAGFCEDHALSMYFLGGRQGVAAEARRRLVARHPNLQVVGTQHGFFNKAPRSQENRAVVQRIHALEPNLLIVGMGMPIQERWLKENWDRLETNVVLTGGAVFDYISGRLPRPPRFLTDHGLEWLGRLIIEPRRLWRRYLLGNPKFVWRVLKQGLSG